MQVPTLTPPFPRETLDDRRFVLRVEAWMSAFGAAWLATVAAAAGTLRPLPWAFAFVAGAVQSALVLRGAPRLAVAAARIAMFAGFAVGLALPTS